LYIDNHGYTGMMTTADPDLKKKKVMKFLKSKKAYRENMNLESIYEDIKEDEGKTISLYPFYNEKLAQKLSTMGIKDGYDWDEFLVKKLGGLWKGDPEGDGTMMYNVQEPLYSELRDKIKILLKQIMTDTLEEGFLTDNRYILYYTNKNGEEKSIGFLSGLNAEDEFYRLMDDENIVSAKIDYVYTKDGKPKLSMEFTRDESGEADVKFG